MDKERDVASPAPSGATVKSWRPRNEQRTILVDHTGKPPAPDAADYLRINTHDHDWKMK
ncbi:MAG: hypothetical protein Athens041674_403 [Parcubacteria group bacterium Athens0416_74]|nr:MAG: hypothetical protein Athens041674_403 [Parcubacteria group bacterium Athens0416_74]